MIGLNRTVSLNKRGNSVLDLAVECLALIKTQLLLNGGHGERMVEVNIFVEPLHSGVSLVGVKKGLVDWLKILQSSLLRHEFVGWLQGWLVTLSDSKGQPSLLALWVDCVGQVVVGIDFG